MRSMVQWARGVHASWGSFQMLPVQRGRGSSACARRGDPGCTGWATVVDYPPGSYPVIFLFPATAAPANLVVSRDARSDRR